MASIIIVSEYVNEAQNSTGYVWSKIINHLSNENLAVKVVYVEDEAVMENSSEINFYPVNRTLINHKSILLKVWGHFKLSVKFFFKVCIVIKPGDMVFTGTNPSMFLLFVPFLKYFFKFKWFLLVHDVYPNNLIPAGLINSRFSLRYKILDYVFCYVYKRADVLIAIGRDMSEVLESKVGSSKNIIFVPNSVDASEIFPVNASDFLEKRGIKLDSESVVFQFFGNLGRVQGVENVLQALKLTTDKNLVFIFFGRGVYLEHIKNFIETNHKLRVYYGGDVLPQDKNECLSSCDVALVTLESNMYGLGVPSKSYFNMAADKPILAVMAYQSEIARVINDDGIGWHCLPNKPTELASIMDSITSNRTYKQMPSSRSLLIDKYSLEISLIKITQKIKSELSI